MTTKKKRNFVVLGGVGAIGRVVVRDLFESHPRNRILIADYNEAGARTYARSFRGRRVSAAFADAGRSKQLAKLFRGHTVVINCTQHGFNLKVIRAALAAKVHYTDLGGLFLWTRKQLKLDKAFKRAGLTAVLGSGCSPGITNVMTRAAADRLDRITAVRIRVGAKDLNGRSADFCFPYSAQTIVEELTLKPWVFARGKFQQAKPRTGWERVDFSRPVGAQWVVLTRHSEIATIPLTFRGKGLRECDFKVGFDRKFVREVHGDRKTVTMDCHAKANRRWHASAGDVDTGCPPSIIAQMIATGIIAQRGVLAPEVAVPVQPFFRELRQRGMKIVVKESKS